MNNYFYANFGFYIEIKNRTGAEQNTHEIRIRLNYHLMEQNISIFSQLDVPSTWDQPGVTKMAQLNAAQQKGLSRGHKANIFGKVVWGGRSLGISLVQQFSLSIHKRNSQSWFSKYCLVCKCKRKLWASLQNNSHEFIVFRVLTEINIASVYTITWRPKH